MVRERSHRQAVLTGMDRELFLGVELAMVRQGAASYQEVGWCAGASFDSQTSKCVDDFVKHLTREASGVRVLPTDVVTPDDVDCGAVRPRDFGSSPVAEAGSGAGDLPPKPAGSSQS